MPRTIDNGWSRLSGAIEGVRLPAALVDLDAFDRNADVLFGLANTHQKRLRVATKSVRVPALIRRLVDRGGRGLMCYAAAEARHLAEVHGFDDLLVAYPTLQAQDLDDLAFLAASGRDVSLVVDSIEHVERAAARAKGIGATLSLVIEIDLALEKLGMRIGALRSPIHDVETAVRLAEHIEETPHVRFHGVMGYEAHVAGLPDRGRTKRWQNPIKRALKLASRGPLEHRRADLREALREKGLQPTVYNGGGSGSLAWCVREAALTEVTAGSGFLDGHLFDGYRDVTFEPALLFALSIGRAPAPGIVTANGGGYIASGEAGVDRLPIPWAPPGLSLTTVEGAGEVQTPILGSKTLKPGDPVFFRPAKTGELAERFSEYLLISGDRIAERVPTYRGEGKMF